MEMNVKKKSTAMNAVVWSGGLCEARTHDNLVVTQVLSQLS